MIRPIHRFDTAIARNRFSLRTAYTAFRENVAPVATPSHTPARGSWIEVFEYYSTTGSGAATGFLAAQYLRQGSAGTLVPQLALEYASHTAGGATVHPVSKQTVYREDNGTDPIVTTFAHSFHPGTTQVAEAITTLPAVPTSQNGTGVAAITREYCDILGRLTWSMNERGIISHRVYSLATGTLAQLIDDVNTSIVSGAPVGWVTPSGAGLNLVTDFQHDAQGRLVQKLGPEHLADVSGVATLVRRATWHVYDDLKHITYTASGYRISSTSASVLAGPVAITKSKANGKVLEKIRAVAPSNSGTLASIIATAGGAEAAFPQSSYVRWNTNQYTDCCQLDSRRVYFNIPAGGPGIKGTHYNETRFGYDSMRRLDRTIKPRGGVSLQTYDPRGLVLQNSIGVDDDGTIVDIVLVSENEYDHGLAGGDGNLTKETQHVSASETRVKQYGYDWRNRQTVIDGELDFYQLSTFDNLNHVIQVDRHDTSALGTLVARSENKFDKRGRGYRTIRYAVNRQTGAITGSQTHDTTYDQAANVLRQEPAGNMEYQESQYDSLGRRKQTSDPLGNTTKFGFDNAGNPISTTDPMNQVWTAGFDPLGRLVRSTNPLNQSTTYGFDNAGDQSTVTNALFETTTTHRDAAGRTTSIVNPLGKITQFGYDADSNQTTVTDPNNLTSQSQYNLRDWLIKQIDPAGHETLYAYNRLGEKIKETDAKGKDTLWGYDALGREITITDRLNQVTQFAWNVLGLQASMTDAQSQTTSYLYDDYGRASQTIWPDHVPSTVPGDPGYGITQTQYDALNRVLRTTDQLGDTVTNNYDAAGRRLSKDHRTRANSPSGPISDSDTFTYNANSLLLTAVCGRYNNTVTLGYDAANRQTSNSLTIFGVTYTSTTQHDAAGRVIKLTHPDGSEVNRGYTARGQLHMLALGSTTIDTRGYDDGGRLTVSAYNNGVSESRSYDNDSLVTAIASKSTRSIRGALAKVK